MRLIIVLLCVLPACHPYHIEGLVTDIKDEPLPGVAVAVQGTGYQSLSDAHGAYRVPFEPGQLTLVFAKTGYTVGRLDVDAGPQRAVQAATVKLWNLPRESGVYHYEDFKYRQAPALIPKRYETLNFGVLYGIEQFEALGAADLHPLILCYRMPMQGVRMYRLDYTEAEIKEPDGSSRNVDIYAPSHQIPVAPAPIDEPERTLIEVRYGGPLEAGLYAIHWGALDGVTEPEPRIFLFNLVQTAPQLAEPSAADDSNNASAP